MVQQAADISGYLAPQNQQSPYSAQPPVVQLYSEGAPLLGIDFRNTLTTSRPQTCINMRNFICRSTTVDIRRGYRIWQNKLDSAVGTLMAYESPSAGSNKLFAVTDLGIYDVTTRTNNVVTPVKVVTWPSPILGKSRYTSHVMYATTATIFLCVVTAGNGYWTYNGATWTQRVAGGGPNDINGTDPTQFDFVFPWKNRLWFVKAGESDAWYLALNAIAGNIARFDFGAQMIHGGAIAVLESLSLDGGAGIDDYFILIGSKGDVVIYEGTDPSNVTTFRIKGRWYIGNVPVNRRFTLKYGSDVLCITNNGLISLGALLQGITINQIMFESIGAPINGVLGLEVQSGASLNGWEIHLIPKEDQITVSLPISVFNPGVDIYSCFALNNAWTTLGGLPAQTIGIFDNIPYGADDAGNVYQLFTGTTDNVQFDDLPAIIPEASLQSSYQTYGSPATFAKFNMLTLIFLGSSFPSVKVAIAREFGIYTPPGTPSVPGSQSSTWNNVLWNVGVWAGGAAGTYIARLGLSGIAYYAGILMSVTGFGGTRYTGMSIAYEKGDSML